MTGSPAPDAAPPVNALADIRLAVHKVYDGVNAVDFVGGKSWPPCKVAVSSDRTVLVAPCVWTCSGGV